MNSRRTALVAMLVAAEIVIIGLALHAVTAGGYWAHSGGSLKFQQASYTTRPIAALDAGTTPIVRISDPSSQVTVSLSTDAQVHVQDETSLSGPAWSNIKTIPQLQVARTDDGVSIERADYDLVSIGFSMTHQQIDVQVPKGASIEIVKCSGADIAGVQNDVKVASQDGDVSLRDIRGNVVAQSDDGHISIERAQGSSIDLSSSDGRITLTGVSAESLNVHSGDGSIRASDVAIAGNGPKATLHSDDGSVEVGGIFAAAGDYQISSDDGHVTVALAPDSNTTVDASSDDGSVTVDGRSNSGDDDNNQQTLRVGDGSGTMHVTSGDGSIHITTNGAE